MTNADTVEPPPGRRGMRSLRAAGLMTAFALTLAWAARPAEYQPGLRPDPSNAAFAAERGLIKLAAVDPAIDAEGARPLPADVLQAVAAFDACVAEVSGEVAIELAPPADWRTVCRRLSLALLGSQMSLQDVLELERQPEATRVERFAESCLSDSRWSDYWATHLRRAWIGDQNGPFLLYRERMFRLWLADRLRQDAAYDGLVRSMLTAEGLWTDRPEVNFYTATFDGDDEGRADPVRIAGRAARVFLGRRIDCLQCHDDFIGNNDIPAPDGTRGGTQRDFHTLAAAFAGVAVPNPLTGLVDDGEPYEVTLLGQAEPSEVEPALPFVGQPIAADRSRRVALSRWITAEDNRWFARATANRLWAMMTGEPLVRPIDHIAEDHPMFGPLDRLADVLLACEFKIQPFIRAVARSETFRRGSRATDFVPTERHETLWAVYPVQRLRPEQIAASLQQASRLTRLGDDNILSQLDRGGKASRFVGQFGATSDVELRPAEVTINQRLLMLNGQLAKEAARPGLLDSGCGKIAAFVKSPRERIRLAYLLVLNREPGEDEYRELAELAPGGGRASLSDVAAGLLNAAEFQWNY